MIASDPILVALDAANAAEHAHIAACSDLDESDVAATRRCKAACDRAAAARRDLMQLTPTTIGGLQALAAHDSRWCEAGAEDDLVHIARSPRGCDSERPLRPSGGAESHLSQAHGSVNPLADRQRHPGFEMRVPGPLDLGVAWARLDPADRDRIGLVVLDMILQAFVHGDACVVGGQPEDRPFPDDTDEHEQIRGTA